MTSLLRNKALRLSPGAGSLPEDLSSPDPSGWTQYAPQSPTTNPILAPPHSNAPKDSGAYKSSPTAPLAVESASMLALSNSTTQR